jgi:hypothetical protein
VAQFIVTDQQGRRFRATGPDGSTQEQAQQQFNSRQPPAAPPAGGGLPSAPSDATWGDVATSFGKGALQGAVLDPIEGIGQGYERFTGRHIPVPQAARDWFSRFSDEAGRTSAGRIGNWAGTIGSFLIPGAGLESLAARSAGAANTALRSARMGYRAGPEGYAAVRRALTWPEQGAKQAVERATSGKAGAGKWEAVQDYFDPRVRPPPLRPSTATAARSQTASARRLSDFERRAYEQRDAAGRLIREHPTAVGTAAGAAAGASRPVPEDQDYWKTKAAQTGLGAAGGAASGSGALPAVIRHAATHKLERIPLHYGLWHLTQHPVTAIGSMVTLEALAQAVRSGGGRAVVDALERWGAKPATAAATGAMAGKFGGWAEGIREDVQSDQRPDPLRPPPERLPIHRSKENIR